MTNLYQNELHIAKKAAIQAGEAIMKFYGQSPQVTHKSPSQPLTQADLAANQIITETLHKNFPTDALLSEENIETVFSPERLNSQRVWIIDPLDGTIEFINQNPQFAVSISLVENQKPVVGVVYNPVTQELFSAAKNDGCFLNETTVNINHNIALTDIQLLVSQSEYQRGEWQEFEKDFNITAIGSVAYKMALVAAGKADASFTLYSKSEWDVAAGSILVEESGGIVSTAKGQEILFNQENPKIKSLVYAHPNLHHYLLEIIQKKSLKTGQ